MHKAPLQTLLMDAGGGAHAHRHGSDMSGARARAHLLCCRPHQAAAAPLPTRCRKPTAVSLSPVVTWSRGVKLKFTLGQN